MEPIDLKFKGLLPASEFIKTRLYDRNDKKKIRFEPSDKIPEESEHPGVYIWGFMIKERFIPYYVGKHEKSIAERITEHIRDIMKHDSTYTRLKKDYMEGENGVAPFYRDDHKKYFIISNHKLKNKLSQEFKDNKKYLMDRLEYLNNWEFFKEKGITLSKLAKGQKGDYPICHLKNIDDYLYKNIDNIRVSYAVCCYDNNIVCEGIEKKNQENIFFECIEAFTKFHLKGNTASRSKPFKCWDKYNLKIILSPGNLDIFKPSPSETFDGYA